MYDLFFYMDLYGSDKTLSRYTEVYQLLFKPIKESTTSVLEVGVGTIMPEIPSTFCGNIGRRPNYTPGGSLRSWRDYFPNASIKGVDIAEDCLIKEDRIETFIFNSSIANECDSHLKGLEFDIIIDDGDHSGSSQIKTFENLFKCVKNDGYYFIEDIQGGIDGHPLIDYKDDFLRILGDNEFFDRGNLIVIKKTGSGKGQVFDVEEFLGETKSILPAPPPNEVALNIAPDTSLESSNLTIVSGLWDLSIDGRKFEEHYLPRFEEFLKIPCNMVLIIPKSLEEFVLSRRSLENTSIRIYELDDIQNGMFSPFWDRWQEIRTSPEWLDGAAWLPNSPQATKEHYFPIQSCKMFFMHDAKVSNRFDSEYFLWMDAGLTSTVPKDLFYKPENLKRITEYIDPFLFISYPYEAETEIHGFKIDAMNRYSDDTVKYVCRGGLWGCHRDFLSEANAQYYHLYDRTLSEGLGGAEECVFTILSYLYPEYYRRYAIDSNGLIVKFMGAIDSDDVELEKIEKKQQQPVFKPEVKSTLGIKTNLYFLTFNYPDQLEYTITSLASHNGFLDQTHQKVIIDNSTDEQARIDNKNICDKYGFEHVIRGENTGICGGRQFAAEHFHDSDADFYLFFEDDMTLAGPEEGNHCRNGLRKYIPDLYLKLHQIMLKEEFDFLKLSFTEVFMDNNIQTSWYNVPQDIRDRDWPDYNTLPTTGLDPYSPRTEFDKIERLEDGLCYITGEIYYANWPMIVSREGNRKMFIDTKWAYPYEQTWMSHMYQETKKGNLKPAILLASPVTHERFKFYAAEERREC
jgi:hypothetical protein